MYGTFAQENDSRIYWGTRAEICWFAVPLHSFSRMGLDEWATWAWYSPSVLMDLTFSTAADTVLLPYTMTYQSPFLFKPSERAESGTFACPYSGDSDVSVGRAVRFLIVPAIFDQKQTP